MVTPQIGTLTKCCLRHDNICSVSLPLMYNYMTKPRKQNMLVVMPVYRRIYAFNLNLHLLFLIALQPRIAHTYSLFSWLKANASKTKELTSSVYANSLSRVPLPREILNSPYSA